MIIISRLIVHVNIVNPSDVECLCLTASAISAQGLISSLHIIAPVLYISNLTMTVTHQATWTISAAVIVELRALNS